MITLIFICSVLTFLFALFIKKVLSVAFVLLRDASEHFFDDYVHMWLLYDIWSLFSFLYSYDVHMEIVSLYS